MAVEIVWEDFMKFYGQLSAYVQQLIVNKYLPNIKLCSSYLLITKHIDELFLYFIGIWAELMEVHGRIMHKLFGSSVFIIYRSQNNYTYLSSSLKN